MNISRFHFPPPPPIVQQPVAKALAKGQPPPTVLLPAEQERAQRRLDVFEARAPATTPARPAAMAPAQEKAAAPARPAEPPERAAAPSPLARAKEKVADWLIGAGDWLQKLGTREPPAALPPSDPVAQSKRFSGLMAEADGVRSHLRRGEQVAALEGAQRMVGQLASALRDAPWDAELQQLKGMAGGAAAALGKAVSPAEGEAAARRLDDAARHVRHAAAARGGGRPLTDTDVEAAAVVDAARSAIAAARGVNRSGAAPAALEVANVLRGQGRVAEANALEAVAGRMSGAEERGDVKAAATARDVLARSLQAVISASDQGGAQRAKSAAALQRLPAEMQLADRAGDAFSRGDYRGMVDLARQMTPLVAERSGPFVAKDIERFTKALASQLELGKDWDRDPEEVGRTSRLLNAAIRRAQASAAWERESMEKALRAESTGGVLLPVRAAIGLPGTGSRARPSAGPAPA